jgi:hypothetical protein
MLSGIYGHYVKIQLKLEFPTTSSNFASKDSADATLKKKINSGKQGFRILSQYYDYFVLFSIENNLKCNTCIRT